MPGIYVHIPFCRKACTYCNFYFSTSTRQKNELFESLLLEISLHNNWPFREINTIYFGGGTPSIFDPEEIYSILKNLNEFFQIKADAEITLEANPDDLEQTYLEKLRSIGINRLSIGIQTFINRDLSLLNRSHDAEQALRSIKLAQEIGIHNISIDLIYGIPGMSDKEWIENIQRALETGIRHISAYCLTVEEGTALFHQIRKGQVRDIDESQSIRQFEILIDLANNAGFEQYEISNFAMPGYRSRHNSSYWRSEAYLGLGPSAHSYDLHNRYWNVPNIRKYCDAIKNGHVPIEQEKITDEQKFNEYILTRIRTIEGLDMEKIIREFGRENALKVLKNAEDIGEDFVLLKDGNIILTQKGKMLADHITLRLMN